MRTTLLLAAAAIAPALLGAANLSSPSAGRSNPGNPAAQTQHREVIAARPRGPAVDDAVLRDVYEKVKTPHKRGIVVPAPEGKMIDCPSVFRHEGAWYMTYIQFDGAGYETWLATSPDLLQWTTLGRILSFREGTWDGRQVAGYTALQDPLFGGSYALEPFAGRYWLSYVGGALQGYETDPLAIGMAYSSQPHRAVEWQRLDHSVLNRDQPDARHWEKKTQYKSYVLWDKTKSLGPPFVMFYNAKTTDGYERIGMAVSHDMREWFRYGEDPVIDNGSGISGDPQVVRLGEVWVMFYFGAFWKPKAFDTFAVSRDLVTWTRWTGPHLVEPSEPWDETFAHKPWVVFHGGVVYHFYCAVGVRGRCIALATSRPVP